MGDTRNSYLGDLCEMLGAQNLVESRCTAQEATGGPGMERGRDFQAWIPSSGTELSGSG